MFAKHHGERTVGRALHSKYGGSQEAVIGSQANGTLEMKPQVAATRAGVAARSGRKLRTAARAGYVRAKQSLATGLAEIDALAGFDRRLTAGT